MLLALAGTVLTSAPSASAVCTARTTHALSGYVTGADNLDVNVSIGFAVSDAQGRQINVSDGCVMTHGGYSTPQQEKNHYVSGRGAPRNSRMHDAAGHDMGVSTHTWSLTGLPANASAVWIEVYSRGYAGSPCTACFGPRDVSKYGYVMRRPLKPGTANIVLQLPMTCAYHGGSTNRIFGYVTNSAGTRVLPDRVVASSIMPDRNTVPMGWGVAMTSTGSYNLESLASGQKYVVWMTYKGLTQRRSGVVVNPCKITPFNVRV